MKRIFLTVLAAVLCSVALAQSEENTKTGILLANEHKIVVEARRSSMNFNEIEASRATPSTQRCFRVFLRSATPICWPRYMYHTMAA